MKKPKIKDTLSKSPFIDKLKKDYFVITPNALLLAYPDLPDKSKFCFLHLLRYGVISLINGHVDKKGNPVVFIGDGTLAKEMDVSTRTVTRYKKDLKEAGLISVKSRGLKKTALTTLYPPSLEEFKLPEIEAKSGDKLQAPPTPEELGMEDLATQPTKMSTLNQTKMSDNIIESKDIIEKTVVAKQRHTKKPSTSELKSLVAEETKASEERVKERVEVLKKRRKFTGKKKNTNTLLKWFSKECVEKVSKVPPLVAGKEKGLTKKLIDHYTYETTQDIFGWAIDNWDYFRKKFNITSTLNIGIIYGFRDSIVQEMESTKPAPNEPEDSSSAW